MQDQFIRLRGNWDTRKVWLDGKPLRPQHSQRVWNHSPDGFNWSYGGSGPAQLALAVMLKFFPKDEAVMLHQEFKRRHIATLPAEDFDVEINITLFREQYRMDFNN